LKSARRSSHEDVLVKAGVLGSSGLASYYVVPARQAATRSATFTPLTVTLMIAVWAFAFIVPLLVWLLKR
jgi:hypothetical protein